MHIIALIGIALGIDLLVILRWFLVGQTRFRLKSILIFLAIVDVVLVIVYIASKYFVL